MSLIRNILWAAVLSTGALAAQSVSILFENGAVRLAGWTTGAEPAAGWASVLTVRVVAVDTLPMLGTYTVEPQGLTFRPRFPFSPGMTYLAEASLPDGVKVTNRIIVPAADLRATTRVERVYPSADLIPSNILKLYVYFTAPMSKGEAWQRIHLLDSDGKPVLLAFLEIDQELWDSSGRRLTILFDPGRIKRGLVPTTELGSPVTEGRTYRLVIDRDWHDARGAILAEGFEKTFKGGASMRSIPAPTLWKIESPRANTLTPLIIRFPSPMDVALLGRMIRVEGVDGTVTVADLEREWRFLPTQPWKAGTYTIIADNTLEDISGNHLDRPFDIDLATTPVNSGISSGTSTLTLTVK